MVADVARGGWVEHRTESLEGNLVRMSEPLLETRRTYDEITAEYARRNSSVDQRLRDDVRSLTVSLPPGSVVADVGCGPGQEVTLLREHGFRVVGLDFSLGQLRTGGLPGVAQADMRHLPLRTGSLDAVWCQAALLHIPRHDVPDVLAEFARVVRADGALFLSVAEGDDERWEAADRYGSAHRRWFTYHRLPELTALLDVAGFEVRQVGRVPAHRDWLSLHCRRVATRRTYPDGRVRPTGAYGCGRPGRGRRPASRDGRT